MNPRLVYAAALAAASMGAVGGDVITDGPRSSGYTPRSGSSSYRPRRSGRRLQKSTAKKAKAKERMRRESKRRNRAKGKR